MQMTLNALVGSITRESKLRTKTENASTNSTAF